AFQVVDAADGDARPLGQFCLGQVRRSTMLAQHSTKGVLGWSGHRGCPPSDQPQSKTAIERRQTNLLGMIARSEPSLPQPIRSTTTTRAPGDLASFEHPTTTVHLHAVTVRRVWTAGSDGELVNPSSLDSSGHVEA